MKTLFILPPKTISQTSLSEWNNLISSDDVILTARSEEYGITDDYLKQINCAIYTFNNLNSSGLIEKRVIDLHKRSRFSRIISTAEADVIRAAKLREYLTIPGQDVNSAIVFRDKEKMKAIVSKNGIKTPTFKKISSATDLINFIDQVGYSIVVKPNRGAGSANTIIIKNETQLESFLESGLMDSSYGELDIIAESFVKGNMYHVDGMVIKGNIIINHPSAYVNSCIEFQKGTHVGSYTLEENNPLALRLKELNAQVISILPSPTNFAFHAEYFHDENDQLIFCEIACRPGGAVIKDALFEIYKVNIVTEWMKSEIKPDYRDPTVAHQPNLIAGFLLIPPTKGLLKSIPAEIPFDWVKQYRVTAKIDSEYKENVRTSGEIISILATSPNEKYMIDYIKTLSSWANENVIWS